MDSAPKSIIVDMMHEFEDSDVDYDSGSEKGSLEPLPEASLRCEQREIFSKWMTRRAQAYIQDIPQTVNITSSSPESINQANVRRDEAIISDPREYQIELFERAKNGNTIVVLDTGRGCYQV